MARDWDKELAKIDKQLESISDEAILSSAQAKTPAEKQQVKEVQRTTNTAGVFARLLLAIALGIAMLMWPYSARCGVGLFFYLFATGTVVTAGVWSAVWTWRHRAGRAHLLSLLLVLWGGLLAAIEILPRVHYARADSARSAWICP
ncbi:MAG TPA: hypothetical protein VEI06_08800 [Gemmatimonadaceae bacterium]|nr:hypothetical protein [Gemmatimonadaceae bacterium]